MQKNVISAQSPQLLRGLELTGCGANELIDPCPSSFASLLEIHLVASVYDVESLLDGPCGEIGELLIHASAGVDAPARGLLRGLGTCP